jgi:histidinol-phosphate/aromatic aminotransferase/cobyric acid decarboxylase-like protein
LRLSQFQNHHSNQPLDNSDALVVLDEAYYAYANDSFLDDIKKYPNLVLLRTVSKIGFAGLRLGLLVGAQDTVFCLSVANSLLAFGALNKIKLACDG